MKKVCTILLTTILMLIGLSGCKSSEKEIRRTLLSRGDINAWTCDSGGTMIVKDDYISISGSDSISGEYDIDGDELTITPDNGGSERTYTVKVEDDIKMIFKDEDGDKTEWRSASQAALDSLKELDILR